MFLFFVRVVPDGAADTGPLWGFCPRVRRNDHRGNEIQGHRGYGGQTGAHLFDARYGKDRRPCEGNGKGCPDGTGYTNAWDRDGEGASDRLAIADGGLHQQGQHCCIGYGFDKAAQRNCGQAD